MLANPHPDLNIQQKIALASLAVSALIFGLALFNLSTTGFNLIAALATLSLGTLLWTYYSFALSPEGIKNNGIWQNTFKNKGIGGWMLGILLTSFYICLYWYPKYLSGLVTLFSPLSEFIKGKPADQWFVYGTFYTIGVLLMGARFAFKYRHNRYQLIRTASVCFFQLGFAFLLPSFMALMNEPEYYFSYFWPLKLDPLMPSGIAYVVKSSSHQLGWYFIGFSALMTFIGTPILTYFFGKRWYCSWVCGCGGLAETVGDPFRQLSNKSTTAWKIERWMIHAVLVLVIGMTVLLWVDSYNKGLLLGDFSKNYAKWYGFLIGSTFSGVIGTGFYPILGNRSWCRFGCPQAAILGLFQRKKSKFRITTNGGQCISCGNCSTYCEMGIDVRSYAQKGQDVLRASCVGCGICSAVCPRGVLKLENIGGDLSQRANQQRTVHVRIEDIGIIG